MGKIANDREDLSKLLNGVQKSTISIDETIPEIKSLKKTKKKSSACVEYCGVEIPLEIHKICMEIEEALKSQGKYTKPLDFQIMNTAVQIYLYARLVRNLVEDNSYVHTRELTTSSESLRRALQYVGLTIDAKKGALNAEDSIENNPLANFLDNMNAESGSEQKIIKKKKPNK